MDINRKEFEDILMSTIVPSSLPYEEQMHLYKKVQDSAMAIMPQKMYRYRRCNKNNIDAFADDLLWVSTADCMNDGFDSRMYFDNDEVEKWVSMIQNTNFKQDQLMNLELIKPGIPLEMNYWRNLLASFSQEQFDAIIETIIEWIRSQTLSSQQVLPSIGQQTMKFCCFSESIDSPYMWGQYTDDEKGFALEYDFTTIPYAEPPAIDKDRSCFILPVIYNDNRFQVSSEYVRYLLMYRLNYLALTGSGAISKYPDFSQKWLVSIGCPDLSQPTKMALHKSTEWEIEKEWRMFCSSNRDVEFINAKQGCCIKRAQALYLGRRINCDEEMKLRNIAMEKRIPVYKMLIDEKSPKYKLIANP